MSRKQRLVTITITMTIIFSVGVGAVVVRGRRLLCHARFLEPIDADERVLSATVHESKRRFVAVTMVPIRMVINVCFVCWLERCITAMLSSPPCHQGANQHRNYVRAERRRCGTKPGALSMNRPGDPSQFTRQTFDEPNDRRTAPPSLFVDVTPIGLFRQPPLQPHHQAQRHGTTFHPPLVVVHQHVPSRTSRKHVCVIWERRSNACPTINGLSTASGTCLWELRVTFIPIHDDYGERAARPFVSRAALTRFDMPHWRTFYHSRT
jgi:hypothetical protein